MLFNKIKDGLFGTSDEHKLKQEDFESRVEAYNAKHMGTGSTEKKTQPPNVQKNKNTTELSLSNFQSNILAAATANATEFYNEALSDQEIKNVVRQFFPNNIPNDDVKIVSAQIFKAFTYFFLVDEYHQENLRDDMELLKTFTYSRPKHEELALWAQCYSVYAGTSTVDVLIKSGKLEKSDAKKVLSTNIEPIIELIGQTLASNSFRFDGNRTYQSPTPIETQSTQQQRAKVAEPKLDEFVGEMAKFLSDDNADPKAKILELLKQAVPGFAPNSERGRMLIEGLTGKKEDEPQMEDHLVDIKMGFAASQMSEKLKLAYDSIDLDSINKISKSNEVFTHFIGDPRKFYREFKEHTTVNDFGVGASFVMANSDRDLLSWIEQKFIKANKYQCFAYVVGCTQQAELFSNRNVFENILKMSNVRMNDFITEGNKANEAVNLTSVHASSSNENQQALESERSDYASFFPNLNRNYEVNPDSVNNANTIIAVFDKLYKSVIQGTKLFVEGTGPQKDGDPIFDDIESFYKHNIYGGLISYHLQSALYSQPKLFSTVMALCEQTNKAHLKDLIAFSSLKPFLAYAYDQLIVPVMKGGDVKKVSHSFIANAPSWLQVDIENFEDNSKTAILNRFLKYAATLQLGIFIASAQTGILKRIVDNPLEEVSDIAKEYSVTWISTNLSNALMMMKKMSNYQSAGLDYYPNQGPNIALMVLFYMQQLNIDVFGDGKKAYRYPVDDIAKFEDPSIAMRASQGGKVIFEEYV